MSIVVTGASGQLGRLVVESLLARGVPADQIVAAGRNADRLAELAGTGVRTAVIDFADPATLKEAFAGADALLLVSGNEVGQRVDQHRNAVEAAKEAGVGRIVYTSAPKATTSALVLAPEHKATEEIIAASGLPSTILRNGWYHEKQLPALEQARSTGEIVASAGAGRTASASRRDFAEAAAVVLIEDGHVGKVYELSGDTSWDYTELAATFAEILGRPVIYRSVTPEEHRQNLLSAGLDEGTAGFVVALDGNTRDGLLAATTGELRTLIGRPTTPLAEGLRTSL
jgi:NAD(P)H dehydrogenase (quinone)